VFGTLELLLVLLGVVLRLQRGVARVVPLQADAFGSRHRLAVLPRLPALAVAVEVDQCVSDHLAGVLLRGEALVHLVDKPSDPGLRTVGQGDVSLCHRRTFVAILKGIRLCDARAPTAHPDAVAPEPTPVSVHVVSKTYCCSNTFVSVPCIVSWYHMPEVKFEVDVDSPPDEQPTAKPFNRWHPDIPPVVEAEPGETIRLEALDWTGGQISDNDDPNEVRDVDLTQVHYLAGPVRVEGRSPVTC